MQPCAFSDNISFLGDYNTRPISLRILCLEDGVCRKSRGNTAENQKLYTPSTSGECACYQNPMQLSCGEISEVKKNDMIHDCAFLASTTR